MKSKPKRQDYPGSGADRAGRKGEERAEHVDAFKKRERRPGEAGLANEARPGLGTRADEDDPKAEEGRPLRIGRVRAPKAARVYREPGLAPQEEPADEFVRDEERSTGMSGQSGGT